MALLSCSRVVTVEVHAHDVLGTRLSTITNATSTLAIRFFIDFLPDRSFVVTACNDLHLSVY